MSKRVPYAEPIAQLVRDLQLLLKAAQSRHGVCQIDICDAHAAPRWADRASIAHRSADLEPLFKTGQGLRQLTAMEQNHPDSPKRIAKPRLIGGRFAI